MAKIDPWAAKDHGGDSLSVLLGPLVGDAVRSVHYVVPRGGFWPEGHRESRVHEVDMAVKMTMDSGTAVVLSWEMDGLNEGLAIESSPTMDAHSLPGDVIDVSSNADWSRLLGRSIVSISTAWHVPNEGCPEMPWAFRFAFTEGVHLVIALGEAEEEVAYSPDSLVVIFDEEIAASYRIPASSTSSYG